MSEEGALGDLLGRIATLEADARFILASHEDSTSRVLTLEQTYSRLTGLSIKQDELFREALRATEFGLFRAAHVLAWAGFLDYFHNYLLPIHESALQVARPKWKLGGIEDLREQSDHAVIEAAKEAEVINKTLMKALHGGLTRRNECAHPTDYFPDLNQTLGYISEMFSRIEGMAARKPTET
jgi:hypothetical protein